MMTSSMSDHIILIGLGKLGYRTLRLLRELGEPIVVIERDSETEFLDELRRDGIPLLIGDARRESLLEDANIAKAKSIVLATNDDLGNLEVALDARRLNPDIRVVLRMFDPNMADKIRSGFAIPITMSQSATAAPAFATAAIDESMIASFIVDGQLVAMQRWRVQSEDPLAGLTVGEVMERLSVSVVELRSPGRAPHLFPPPAQRLAVLDEIILQGAFDNLKALRR